jgi:hypothetical protein
MRWLPLDGAVHAIDLGLRQARRDVVVERFTLDAVVSGPTALAIAVR